MSDRPAIPDPMKRKVRQECCFGCVLCGAPFFDYDHIIPYSEVRSHEASNLALLCKNHHGDKTAGRLAAERVRHARKKPANRGKLTSAGYPFEGSRIFDVKVGDTEVLATQQVDSEFSVLWLNGRSMFSVTSEDGWFTFSFRLTDESGETILQAEKGELKATTQMFDYTFEGNQIVIRRALGDVVLAMRLSNDGVHIEKGRFTDSHGDGFTIDGISFFVIVGNQPFTGIFGGSCSGTKGAFALANWNHMDQSRDPEGFGYLRTKTLRSEET